MFAKKISSIKKRGFIVPQNGESFWHDNATYQYVIVKDAPGYSFTLSLRRINYSWHSMENFGVDEEVLSLGLKKLTTMQRMIKLWLSEVGSPKLWREYCEAYPNKVMKETVYLNPIDSPATGSITVYYNTKDAVKNKCPAVFIEIGSCNQSFRFVMDPDDIRMLKGIVKVLDKAIADFKRIMYQ